MNMNKINWLEVILKTLSYFLTLLLGMLGMSMMSSCTSQRGFVSRGTGKVVINDTILFDHGSSLKYSNNVFKFK